MTEEQYQKDKEEWLRLKEKWISKYKLNKLQI